MNVLYDNDAYREQFMERVYEILIDDPDNDRANQIINLFDAAPAVEANTFQSGENEQTLQILSALTEHLSGDEKAAVEKAINVMNYPLDAFICEEIPFRLADSFDLPLSEQPRALVDKLTAALQADSSPLFDNEGFDEWIGDFCTRHAKEYGLKGYCEVSDTVGGYANRIVARDMFNIFRTDAEAAAAAKSDGIALIENLPLNLEDKDFGYYVDTPDNRVTLSVHLHNRGIRKWRSVLGEERSEK